MAGEPSAAPLVLRRLALLGDPADGPTDADLLADFLGRRDELAFELLVRRHGPMVLGVCRRVLRHEADAEDAFQATFLVLLRKAATIVPRSGVGNWLYGVAHNTALKARAMSQSRRSHEQQARPAEPNSAPSQEDLDRLDAELARLPDVYREVIVLCELEGKTLQETARQLGCPVGTVASRLARGRALLARRLSGGALGLAAPATVPAGLVTSTLTAAETFAAGGAISTTLTTLVQGVLKTMLWTKLKTTACLLLLTATLGVGLGTIGGVGRAQEPGVTVLAAQFRPPADAPAQPQPWKEKATLVGHTDRVNSLAITPDGKILASAGSDNTVRLWDLATGQERTVLRRHNDWVRSVTFSPDGKLLASAGNDPVLLLVDAATGKLLLKLAVGKERPLAVAFSPEGKLVGVVSADGAMKIWDVATGKLVEEKQPAVAAPATAMAFSPDGQRLYSADMKGVVRIWDAATGKAVEPIETPHTKGVWSMSFTPTGKEYVLGGFDGKVTVWAVDGKKPLVVLPGHTQSVRSVAISPDGRIVASGSQENFLSQLRLWDVKTGKEIGTFEFERGGDVTAVIFSPDGKKLICVSRGTLVPGVRSITLRIFEPAGK